MKFVSNPREVDAFVITHVAVHQGQDQIHPHAGSVLLVTLDDGRKAICDAGMTARFVPAIGDYYIVGPDGYEYLNPKVVFESHYTRKDLAPARPALVPAKQSSKKKGARQCLPA